MRAFDRISSTHQRRYVNVVGGTTDSNPELDERKSCPRAICNGRALIWREDITSWYCPSCSYTSAQQQREIETYSSPTITSSGTTSSNNADKPRLKNSKHDIIIDESSVYIIPATRTRSEEQEDYLRRKRFSGLDKDTDKLESRGLTIIDSIEHIPDADHTTISGEDLKREKERRTTKGRTTW